MEMRLKWIAKSSDELKQRIAQEQEMVLFPYLRF